MLPVACGQCVLNVQKSETAAGLLMIGPYVRILFAFREYFFDTLKLVISSTKMVLRVKIWI